MGDEDKFSGDTRLATRHDSYDVLVHSFGNNEAGRKCEKEREDSDEHGNVSLIGALGRVSTTWMYCSRYFMERGKAWNREKRLGQEGFRGC